jgi:DNA-binding response OmpR family regulator
MQVGILSLQPESVDILAALLQQASLPCRRLDPATAIAAHPHDLDLLVLDLPLPSPESLIRQLRRQRPACAILLIADARDDAGILGALAAGADDYLLRPLRRHDLLARLRLLHQRRHPPPLPERLMFGTYAFDEEHCLAWRGEHPVRLTNKEFQVALLLFRHLGRPLSRAFLAESVWQSDPELPTRTVDTHVSRVRTKLDLRPANGFRLLPVYSFGYQLEAAEPPDSALPE